MHGVESGDVPQALAALRGATVPLAGLHQSERNALLLLGPGWGGGETGSHVELFFADSADYFPFSALNDFSLAIGRSSEVGTDKLSMTFKNYPETSFSDSQL